MLLSLESPQWAQLRHSFGSGGNVPGLILALGNGEQTEAAKDAWNSLWGEVHHQGDTYSACFAALPHIVRIALEGSIPCSWDFFAWPASVEVHRVQSSRPVMPPDLLPAYEWAMGKIPDAVQRHANRPWDHEFAQAAAAALVASRGQVLLADILLELGPSVSGQFMKWQFGNDA
jgi:hypothetical protein